MVLGFKEKFKPLILSGTKIHTIREDKHDRWKAGNTIHFATGVRTKRYNQFSDGACKSVQKIRLVNHGNHVFCMVYIDEVKYVHNDCVDFPNGKSVQGLLQMIAQNDGLNVLEFRDWFIPKAGDIFDGKIIHWTDFLYAGEL